MSFLIWYKTSYFPIHNELITMQSPHLLGIYGMSLELSYHTLRRFWPLRCRRHPRQEIADRKLLVLLPAPFIFEIERVTQWIVTELNRIVRDLSLGSTDQAEAPVTHLWQVRCQPTAVAEGRRAAVHLVIVAVSSGTEAAEVTYGGSEAVPERERARIRLTHRRHLFADGSPLKRMTSIVEWIEFLSDNGEWMRTTI